MSEQTITYVGEPLARQFKDKIEASKKNIANEVERATSKEAALETAITAETERATDAEDILGERIGEEMSRATAVEANLQSEINTIHTAQNCVDIVSTYSELQELDTSILNDNDKVEVLRDELHEDSTYVYRLSKSESGSDPVWEPVGQMGVIIESWRKWSIENGSVGPADSNVIYIGKNDTVSNRDNSIVIGTENTVTTTDESEYGTSDVVSIGTNNSATNAAYAYQFGRDNNVSGNAIASMSPETHQTSINIGAGNSITGEGLNLGKNNTSTTFGMAVGQHNYSSDGSIVAGSWGTATNGSSIFGISNPKSTVDPVTGEQIRESQVISKSGSSIIGIFSNKEILAEGGSLIVASAPNGSSTCYAKNGAILVGTGESLFGSLSVGFSNSAYGQACTIGYNNVAGSTNESKSFASESKSVAMGINNNAKSNSIAVGIDNKTVTGASLSYGVTINNVTIGSGAFGRSITNVSVDSWAIGDNMNDITLGSIAAGLSNRMVSNGSAVLGSYNNAVSNSSMVLGSFNSLKGFSVAVGCRNTATTGDHPHALILGHANKAYNNLEYLATNAIINEPANPAPHSVEIPDVVVDMPNIYILAPEPQTVYISPTKLDSDPVSADSMPNNSYYIESIEGSYRIKIKYNGMPYPINVVTDDGYVNYVYQYDVGYYEDWILHYSGTNEPTFFFIVHPNPTEVFSVDEVTYNSNTYYVDLDYSIITMSNTANVTIQYNMNSDLTSSILLGTQNTVYGHNGIACGCGNIVGDENHWNEPYYNTEYQGAFNYGNDGFAMAIGYHSHAYRNYDIAIGYQSIANGGENIATQHSSAIGYKNIAMNYSTVDGISNIALCDSELTTNIDDNVFGANTYNLLWNAKVNYTAKYPSEIYNGIHQNLLFDFNSNIDAVDLDHNVMFGLGIRTYDMQSFKASTITNNLFMHNGGNRCDIVNYPQEFNISAISNISCNTILNSSIKIVENTVNNFAKNIVLDSSWYISKTHIENFAHNLSITGTIGEYYGNISSYFTAQNVVNNIVLGSSHIFLSDNLSSVDYNLLIGNAVLFAKKYTAPAISASPSNSNNILYNSYGEGIYGCVSFGEGSATSQSKPVSRYSDGTPTIQFSQHVLNFGDNNVTYSSKSVAFGESNVMDGAQLSVVMGRGNNVYTSLDRYGSKGVNGTLIYVLGTSNTISNEYSASSHIHIEGVSNSISIQANDTFIFGGNNQIDKQSSSTSSNPGAFGSVIYGDSNTVYDGVNQYRIFGHSNTISNTLGYAVGQGMTVGNNNTLSNGSNIISLGNGNVSTGHNSVAIGMQLISNQWQTVIGKYNSSVDGPDRLTAGSEETDKALFIIGNGYSDKDDYEWQNETYIHRSNAMVVYADGTVRAKKFVSDEPELVEGTGIEITRDASNARTIVSVNDDLANFLSLITSRPKEAGKTYVLQSTGADGAMSWVELGTTTVN